MFVSLLFIRLLTAELLRRRLEPQPVLDACAVSESQLVDLRYAIPDMSLERALLCAGALSDDASLGLAVAARPPEETLTILAHLALAAPSLAAALEVLSAQTRLLGDGITITVSGGPAPRVALCFAAELGPRTTRYVGELLVGSLVSLCQRIAGPSCVVAASFAHGEPADALQAAQLLGCPVAFDAERASLTLDRVHDEPQPFADTAMFEVLSQAAARLLSGAGRQASFGDQLRSMLSREPNLCELGMSRLARTMGVTQRTFRRRLAAEGLRVSDLVREARLSRACEELGRSDRSIKEVAEQLGYSEPSAFHRAFRSWTGMTPAAYVRTSQASQPLPVKPAARRGH